MREERFKGGIWGGRGDRKKEERGGEGMEGEFRPHLMVAMTLLSMAA